VRVPVCAYCHTVDATLAWTVVGSVAGVAGVIVAIVLGVIPLVKSRRKAHLALSDAAPPVVVSGGRGVQVGSGTQVNIQTYIEHQELSAVPAPGLVVAGEVPQRAAAFQPRAHLMTRLGGRDVTGGWEERWPASTADARTLAGPRSG
jgi:hypothetical protein